MLTDFTLVDKEIDLFLALSSMIADLLVTCVVFGLVFLSKKTAKIVKDSVLCVLISVVLASFFKNIIFDVFHTAFYSAGTIVYYSWLLNYKRLLNQLWLFVTYAAFAIYPVIIRAVTSFFKGAKTFSGRVRTNYSTVKRSFTLQGVNPRPLFHFIS